MLWVCLALIPLSFIIAAGLTALMVRLGHRLGAFDAAGVEGQVKLRARRVPNTGGVGIACGLVLPMLGALAGAFVLDADAQGGGLVGRVAPALGEHLPGLRARAFEAGVFLAALAALHVLGLIDDRRPLGPRLKLGVMALAAAGVATLGRTRMLEFLDAHVGGPWLSIVVTVLWMLAITNAMNFMDNMDGLSAGTGATASGCFLMTALLTGEWFVAGALALLLGSLLGFLVFNAPRQGGARIFMGDGGSLVLGFALAVLTVRATYFDSSNASGAWFGVLTPVAVLAVPLYDLSSVMVIRRSQGRSLWVGDLQHLSHRLVRLGLTRTSAVVVIWGFTGVTGLTGVMLASLPPALAVLAGVQVLLMLAILALFEWSHARRTDDPELTGRA